MAAAVALALSLVLLTSGFHYATLRWLSGGMGRIEMRATRRVLCIVFAIILAHLVEILLYAVSYVVSAEVLGIGRFGGLSVKEPLDYLYFSIVTYTSLGLGDVFPGGHLRFIAGVEALNGLLLIAWSAAFIYLAMGRLWPWEHCAEPKDAGSDAQKGREMAEMAKRDQLLKQSEAQSHRAALRPLGIGEFFPALSGISVLIHITKERECRLMTSASIADAESGKASREKPGSKTREWNRRP